MMKFLAILLAIVSSSTLTYHKILEANGLCEFVDFDDAGCSGLKDALIKDGYTAGACPSTHAKTNCDAAVAEELKSVEALGKMIYGVFCGLNFDLVTHNYACGESRESRRMETYHEVDDLGRCTSLQFDADKCSGLKEDLESTAEEHEYSSGLCPTTYSKSNCDTATLGSSEVALAVVERHYGAFCDKDAGDFTLNMACAETSSETPTIVETLHQIDASGTLCYHTSIYDTACPELSEELKRDAGYISGPCPSTYARSQCHSTIQPELDAVSLMATGFLHIVCKLDVAHFTYSYGCAETRTFHAASSQMSLPDARAYCKGRNDLLAVPRGLSETYAIRALLPSGDVRAWLGLSQDSEMNWISDDTTSHLAWTNWKAEEGNDKFGEKAGAAMVWQKDWKGEWYDMVNDDGRLHYAVCVEVPVEARMRTFHKFDASGDLCTYVDFDRLECTDLTKALEDEGYTPGHCPSTHTESFCTSTAQKEMMPVVILGKSIFSVYCDFDFDDITYGYGCAKGSSAPKCPAECANAIAADASTVTDSHFCSTTMTGLKNGNKHVFPEACNDLGERTVGFCMAEIYQKCVEGSENLRCPLLEYGLPPVLKDCEPETCGEWKEAVDTGCAKEASTCLKDEMQGKLGCTKDGKDLVISSLAPCGDAKRCAKSGKEFCHFDDSLLGSEGRCELCSHTLCAHLTNDKAKKECEAICGQDDCTSGKGCLATCGSKKPATCKQLKSTMESPTGCGKSCNQCYVDLYNAKLGCTGGDKVQSRIDGDSDSCASLSILMLATVAIFCWI